MNTSTRAAALVLSVAIFAVYGFLLLELHGQVPLNQMMFEFVILGFGAVVWIVSLLLPVSVPRIVYTIGEVPILSAGIFAFLCVLIFQTTLKDIAGLLPGYTVTEVVGFTMGSMLIILDLALTVVAAKASRQDQSEQSHSPAQAG